MGVSKNAGSPHSIEIETAGAHTNNLQFPNKRDGMMTICSHCFQSSVFSLLLPTTQQKMFPMLSFTNRKLINSYYLYSPLHWSKVSEQQGTVHISQYVLEY